MSNKLLEIFKRLSQGSRESVQNGNNLDEFDSYMHVARPIEKELRSKMDDIRIAGGGIVFLVGNAGDGKSHVLSSLKSEYSDFHFYNDATESYSPKVDSTETLRIALREFCNDNIDTTCKKYVVAINLGKLNAFVDKFHGFSEYSTIVSRLERLFSKETNYGFDISAVETDRLKVCQFQFQNIYEFKTCDENKEYLDSIFLKTILDRITASDNNNPFYSAYITTKQDNDLIDNPVVINYELLSIDGVKNSIVNYIVEAIIRFKLTVTPREFYNFVYSIIVYNRIESYDKSKDFYNALLHSLFFEGSGSNILNTSRLLDPLKVGNNDHNSDLAILFTSLQIPLNVIDSQFLSMLPNELVEYIKKLYNDNGKNIKEISKLLFRLKHLLSYHSESETYMSFLDIWAGCCRNDKPSKNKLYQLVKTSIPRSYGSYYERDNNVPLNIQGGNSKLFAPVTIKSSTTSTQYNSENVFNPSVVITILANNQSIDLEIDYSMFDYLKSLSNGKLTLNYSNSKNMKYYRFIRQIISASSSEENVLALSPYSAFNLNYDTNLDIISIQAV